MSDLDEETSYDSAVWWECLDLEDVFALVSLHGLLSSKTGFVGPAVAAETAYKFAGAMLEERDRVIRGAKDEKGP